MDTKSFASFNGVELPEEIEAEVQAVESQLNLSDESLTKVMNKLMQEMMKGLSKKTNPRATVKMIPSFVESLPDGTEHGSFLALDLGGTNFRVLLVKITPAQGNEKAQVEMDSQIYKMPEDVITGEGTELFDHIASCMAEFLGRLNLRSSKLPVGFTFSFPCKQEGLNHATLITWTKGFTASGVVGEDVVKLLQDAIKRRGDFDCQLVAVVNDTVGTLMSCAHEASNCRIGLIVEATKLACASTESGQSKDISVDIIAIVNDTVGTMITCSFDHRLCCVGLIVGTGSNACYMEKKANIELLDSNEGDMCINMEWGAFGDDGALNEFRTEYDVECDNHSLNIGKQTYEKMISGMYMGEIVRLVLCKLASQGVLFKGRDYDTIKERGSFDTSYVSQIESVLFNESSKIINSEFAIPQGIPAVQNILAQLDVGAMKVDCEIVIRICQAVSRRAAHLCAAGIAAVARKIKMNYANEKSIVITVGVDGTVYKKHPTFSKIMADKVKQLCNDAGVNVNFALSYDGSGKGAALVTAVAHRLFHEKAASAAPMTNGHS